MKPLIAVFFALIGATSDAIAAVNTEIGVAKIETARTIGPRLFVIHSQASSSQAVEVPDHVHWEETRFDYYLSTWRFGAPEETRYLGSSLTPVGFSLSGQGGRLVVGGVKQLVPTSRVLLRDFSLEGDFVPVEATHRETPIGAIGQRERTSHTITRHVGAEKWVLVQHDVFSDNIPVSERILVGRDNGHYESLGAIDLEVADSLEAERTPALTPRRHILLSIDELIAEARANIPATPRPRGEQICDMRVAEGPEGLTVELLSFKPADDLSSVIYRAFVYEPDKPQKLRRIQETKQRVYSEKYIVTPFFDTHGIATIGEVEDHRLRLRTFARDRKRFDGIVTLEGVWNLPGRWRSVPSLAGPAPLWISSFDDFHFIVMRNSHDGAVEYSNYSVEESSRAPEPKISRLEPPPMGVVEDPTSCKALLGLYP